MIPVVDNDQVLSIMVPVKILLCGIGNSTRGDDAFGPYLVEKLKETDCLKKINCGMHPENYLQKIIDSAPDLVIFVDTISANGKECRLLRDKEITEGLSLSLSTHSLPFRPIYDYIKENCQASIWLLGVKPRSYDIFDQRTRTWAHRIINVLYSLDSEKQLNIIQVYENLSAALR